MKTRVAPPKVRIIRATKRHKLLALEAIQEVDGRRSCDDAALAKFLAHPDCRIFVALEGQRVVGSVNYILWRPHRREPQFLLYEIGVRPEYRNRGIGTALLKRFVEEAQSASASEVWVLTSRSNRAALKMYAHCGFRSEQSGDVMLNVVFRARKSRQAAIGKQKPKRTM